MLRVVVIGAGAVGGYYGARLARAGHDVTFVARGAHLRALRERGLQIWSPLGDFRIKPRAEADTAGIGKADLVLFAVKTYDTEGALRLLPAVTGPRTNVLTLQNGIESADQIASVVGQPPVLGGATYIAATLAAPGIIEQTGTSRRIVLGEIFHAGAEVSERVQELARVLLAADIEAEPVPDARGPVWDKFIFLAAYAGFSAAARQAAGPIWQDPVSREQLLAAAEEIAAVAQAEGIPIAGDVRARISSRLDGAPKTMRASLLMDLLAGRRIEVEALQGAVVRRADAHGIATPIMRTLYAVLRAAAAAPA